ncbi:MAG: GGDEF domain-containing protein, partial [Candidatus Omnitrophica bacterium]|nr:GGDEF domain-containing protein [Candidatus Omnitrophota bacterium]
MKVIVQGSSMLINNLSSYHTEYRRYKSLADQGISSFLIAPLKLAKEPIGLLGIFNKEPFDFTGEELRLLTTFTTHASLIIENARLLETTRRLSITDELTQLYNFRHFQNRFKNEFQRAKRYKHNLSILMCDIDYFKNYNDTNGHEAGNEILKKVAGIMTNSARDVDLIARYGGEEFVLVLIETDKDNAKLFAERLREKIEKETFPHQEKQPEGNLTITIGVAGFPEDAAASDELIERADEALYRGKKEGRNRAIAY